MRDLKLLNDIKHALSGGTWNFDDAFVWLTSMMEENEKLSQHILKDDRDMKYLRDRNAELENVLLPELDAKDEVLEWYANEENYDRELVQREWDGKSMLLSSSVQKDSGTLARSILLKYK